MIDARTTNRMKRIIELVQANAAQATPGSWTMSHSHVIGRDPVTNQLFDIASQPFEKKNTVYGVHPDSGGWGGKDMRYIVTVEPRTMDRFTKDVTELLTERDNIKALAQRICAILIEPEKDLVTDFKPHEVTLLHAIRQYIATENARD